MRRGGEAEGCLEGRELGEAKGRTVAGQYWSSQHEMGRVDSRGNTKRQTPQTKSVITTGHKAGQRAVIKSEAISLR